MIDEPIESPIKHVEINEHAEINEPFEAVKMKIKDETQCPNCNKTTNAKTLTYDHKQICPAKQQNVKNDIEDIVIDKLTKIINDTEQKKSEKIKALISQAI